MAVTAGPAAVPAGVTRGPRSPFWSVDPMIAPGPLPTAATAAVPAAATAAAVPAGWTVPAIPTAGTGCAWCALQKVVTDPSYAVASPAARMQASPAGRQLNEVIGGLLGAAANWASGLPAGEFQNLVAGAVLLVRKQWAGVSSQTLGVTGSTSGTGSSDPTAGSPAPNVNLQGWQLASKVDNLTLTPDENGVFRLTWDAPTLQTLSPTVLSAWGIDPNIVVDSYTVTMKQDVLDPYANDLQLGFPVDGTKKANGTDTAWLAGLSDTTTSPLYAPPTTTGAEPQGPFGTGLVETGTGVSVIPGLATVYTDADTRSYTFDLGAGVDLADTTCTATSTGKNGSTKGGCSVTPTSTTAPSSLPTLADQATVTTVTPNPYARFVFEVTPNFSTPLPNGRTQGISSLRYWSGAEPADPLLSLFLDPTAMLAASDGSVWVAYQRSPLAKVIHTAIGWMNPYSNGMATTLTGYISNKDGTGPGDVLTVTNCESNQGQNCTLPGGGKISSYSQQAITLQTGGAWATAPDYTENGTTATYNLLVGNGLARAGGERIRESQNVGQQFKLTTTTIESTTTEYLNGVPVTVNDYPTVSVATGTAATGWKVPVQLVATPTKLVGTWGDLIKIALGTGSIVTGNFQEFVKIKQAIESMSPEAQAKFLQAAAEPLPEDQVRQYKFVDGQWQLAASFVTTMNGTDGTGGGDTANSPNGEKAVAIPHSLVESADGQIFVASAGLGGGIQGTNSSGWARFAKNLSKQVGYVHRIEAEGITFTGSVGPGSTGTASFTGGISNGKGSAGDILTVAAVSEGNSVPIAPGEILTAAPGTTVKPGTQIKQQLTALVNGAQVPVPQVIGVPFTGAINNGSAGSSGSILTVSTVSSATPLEAGQVIGGPGIAAGTIISAQTTGSTGGPGTYTLSGAPQSITTTAMAASANCGSAGAPSGCSATILGGTGTYQLRPGNSQLVAASTQLEGTYPGSILTVTQMGAGSNPIVVGQTVSAAGLAVGTRIVKQLSGVGGGVGTYLISGVPTVIASTAMSQMSAQTIDLSGAPTWGTFAAAPDGTLWVGVNTFMNNTGKGNGNKIFENGAVEQIAPTSDGSWATQPIKYQFIHPPAGLAITPTSAAPVAFAGSISGTTLTVSQVRSVVVNDSNQVAGVIPLTVGQFIAGDGVAPGTTITKVLTGNGGVGTYQVSTPAGDQTVGVGFTTSFGAAGIEMSADTYALWVNDSEENGRDAAIPATDGVVRVNNSEDFKLKSTIVRIDSSCADASCGNRQDVGRGAMGMIAVPGQDAVLVAVGTTSLLSELGYGGAYVGCRAASDGAGSKYCKLAADGGAVTFGSISKLWKQGSGKIVEVTYNPNAYQADNGGTRTNGLDFLKVSKTLDIPTSWLGTSETMMQDAGRPQSLTLGPDGSIWMAGRGSEGAERAQYLANLNPANLMNGFAAVGAWLTYYVAFANVIVCEDIKGGTGCANSSSFTPVRTAYDWKTAGSPSFVAPVWTPADGLLDTPGAPMALGPIPRIQTFGQVAPFASPVTVDPKTGLPTGAPEGIFAQNSQFGGPLFLPTTPGTPSGLAAAPLVSGVTGESTTLTWKPPATPKRAPVMSYTATAYAGDTSTTVTTAGTSASFTGLQANGGTTYYTVTDANFFGASSDAGGQSAGGQLWLASDGTTVLSTKGLSVGMVSDGTPFTNGGVDRNGHAYSWDVIPGSGSATLGWNGVNFPLGSVASLAVDGAGGQQTNQPNVARSQGQTIMLSAAQKSAQIDTGDKGLDQAINLLNLAGAAVNGGKPNQTITLNYTDGTSEDWTQSFSDWCTPDYNPNEGIISTQSYRDTAAGLRDYTTNYIYGYSHPIAQGKTLESVTLADNPDVILVGLAMSTAIAVSLGQNVSNSPLNTFGITTPPWQVANHQGFDGNGNYYDAYDLDNMTPPGGDVIAKGDPPPKQITMSWAGSAFQVGQIPTSNSEVGGKTGPRNVAQFDGQTIYMPSGSYTNLQMIGAGANGTQSNQNITVNFTDGTTATWTQTFSDWASTPEPGAVTGEAVMNGGTQINQLGNTVNRTANVYGYSYAIAPGKTVQSLTLPTNSNVGILGISLVGTPSVAPWSGVGIVTDGTAISSTGGFDGDGNSYSWNLLTGQPTPASSNFTATINSGAAPGTFTGSITNGKVATFIGTIDSGTVGNAGTILTVSSVAAGSTPVAVGQFVIGAGVADGTAVTGQLTQAAGSKPGGLGTYSVSVPQSVTGVVMQAAQAGQTLVVSSPVTGGSAISVGQTVAGTGVAPGTTVTGVLNTTSGFTGMINNGTAGSPGTTLTVSNVTGKTPLAAGQVISGPGVAAGTTITGQLSGSGTGGVGTYSLNGGGQSIGSTSMTATQLAYSVSVPQFVSPSTPITAISPGNTLTVTSVTGGTITVGQTIGGSNFYTQTNASFTGSINNAQTASFTGGISNGTVGNAGNTLSVVSVTGSTPIAVGQFIAGNGVTSGTAITAFVSGTNGGVGTYTVSGNPQSVAASTTMTAAQPGTTLTVTGIAAPVGVALGIGQAISGPGVAPGTTIAALGTGSGGVGTYTISGPLQWVAPSTTLTTTQPGQPLVADNTTITAFVSGTNGGPGVYTVGGSPQAVPVAPMAGNTKEPLSTLITTTPWNGVDFEIGGPNKPNILRGDGQTVYGSYTQTAEQAAAGTQQLNLAKGIVDACTGGGCVISLAAAGTNGGQSGNTLVLNYADGTSDSIKQSYSDWATPVYISSTSSGGAIGPASFTYSPYPVDSTAPSVGMMSYPGEWIIASQAYRDTASGATQSTTTYVYGYSYWVPEGSTPVSITLPADQNVGVLSVSATKPTMVDLSGYTNAFAITTAPWQVANSQGFDNSGQYYNSDNLNLSWAKGSGSVDSTVYMTWAGAAFQVGAIPTSSGQVGGSDGPKNVVQALGEYYSPSRNEYGYREGTGQTIDLPAPASGESFTNLFLIGASNGTHTGDIVLTFTDGSTATWTQTFSDWASTPTAGSVAGEVLINAGTQINQLGNETGDTANVYGYLYAIPDGMTLKSLTLPYNSNQCHQDVGSCTPSPQIGILGISLL